MPKMSKGHFSDIARAIGVGANVAAANTGLAPPIVALVVKPISIELAKMCQASADSVFSWMNFEQWLRMEFRYALPIQPNPIGYETANNILKLWGSDEIVSYLINPETVQQIMQGLTAVDAPPPTNLDHVLASQPGPIAHPIKGKWLRPGGSGGKDHWVVFLPVEIRDGRFMDHDEYTIGENYTLSDNKQWYKGQAKDPVDNEMAWGYWRQAKDFRWYRVTWDGQEPLP